MRLLALAVLLSSCASVQDRVVESKLAGAQRMLRAEGSALEPVRGAAHSFRYGWYRNLVLVGDTEITVFDPMSDEAAEALVKALPEKPITVVYSHPHLDHIRGGNAFSPREVIAHENAARELDLLGRPANVSFPTRTLHGDATLTLSGVEVELLHLPRSHSDGYLAVWLPAEKILYAPDLAAKKGGLVLQNDNFLPGVLAGMRRLLELPAEIVVPGHFDLCRREDLAHHHRMLARMREVTKEEIAREKTFDATKMSPKTFTRIQRRLRREFGHVEGFDEALLFNTYQLVLGEIGGF